MTVVFYMVVMVKNFGTFIIKIINIFSKTRKECPKLRLLQQSIQKKTSDSWND